MLPDTKVRMIIRGTGRLTKNVTNDKREIVKVIPRMKCTRRTDCRRVTSDKRRIEKGIFWVSLSLLSRPLISLSSSSDLSILISHGFPCR